MPTRPPRQRPRKGHYSCEFCRVRKLRCSRPLPCINCVSRGKACVMGDEEEQEQVIGNGSPSTNDGLLDEVHRLRRLAEDLERRITNESAAAASSPQAPPQRQVIATPTVTRPDAMGPICAVVTHLDRVSMGKGAYSEVQTAGSSTGSPSALSSTTTLAGAQTVRKENVFDQNSLAIKTEPILAIPTAPEYTYSILDGDRIRAPRKYVYLPLQRETTVLVDTFLKSVSSSYHIVHHPTVPLLVSNVYDSVQRQNENGTSLALGDVLLLFSMIATGVFLYIPPSRSSRRTCPFSSRDESARQTPYWIQATLHILEAVVRGPAPPTLSAVQGLITLLFLISNFEGVGYRFRYIISTALVLGRELGLHCIDQEDGYGVCGSSGSSSSPSTPFQRELGRRAWWYLASTDWLLAARNNGPGVGVYQTHPQMMRVREPLNMDDTSFGVDSVDPIRGLPLNVPTDMSYYLQRIRLAKVARGVVDRMPMVSGTQFVGSAASSATSLLNTYRESAVASDAELDAMLRELPPFMRLETYEQTDVEWTDDDNDNSEASQPGHRPNSLFIQAFMLHSLIHTQRCKLHCTYLTSWRRQTGTSLPMSSATSSTSSSSRVQPSVSSSSTTSRAVCIEAARQIILAETQLRKRAARHPFVQSHLSCVLYGVFLASIVLLIDLCADTGEGEDGHDGQESVNTEAASAALQILGDARPHSPAAAELYTSLTQLLAKHRPQLVEDVLQGGAATMTTGVDTTAQMAVPSAPAPTTLDTSAQDDFSFNDALYSNSLSLNFDGLDDLAQFQWDDLLAGVDTTMFV